MRHSGRAKVSGKLVDNEKKKYRDRQTERQTDRQTDRQT
jgi:hypothetical protein